MTQNKIYILDRFALLIYPRLTTDIKQQITDSTIIFFWF